MNNLLQSHTTMTETKTDALLEILLGFLTPLLMIGSTTDTTLARVAAQQAIAEHRAQTHGELVTIAQIVAFALTALDNLRLSVAADLSLPMKLRLRANANGLNRASLQATKILDKARLALEPATADWMEPPEPEPPPAETPVPEPVSSTLPVQQQNRCHWANAMTTVAAELQAASAQVPPTQRKSDQLCEVLSNVATELRQPDAAPTPPGRSKADLFRTTLMAGNGGFPANFLHTPPPKSKPTAK
jgi:hypothetical protein